jgi:uncharacterized protein (DUF1778 family)
MHGVPHPPKPPKSLILKRSERNSELFTNSERNKHKDFSMEEKERQKLTVLVSPEEAEGIKASAATLGISVSEYIRPRTLAAVDRPPTDRLERIVRYNNYVLDRLHMALYAIADAQGAVPTERLRELYQEGFTQSIENLSDLDERITKMERGLATYLAAQTHTAPPAAEKGAA